MRGARLALVLGATWSVLSCTDATSPLMTNVAIVMLETVQGANQRATVGTEAPLTPVVRALDQDGEPVEGANVHFAVTAGDGSIVMDSVVTDGGGIASAGTWTLGTATGRNEVTAMAPDVEPAVFVATGLAAAPAELLKGAGDGQSAMVGTAVAVPPTVRVVDEYGNGVPGVAVSFEVTRGGGSAVGTEAETDSAGAASVVSWTLGTEVGAQELTATAAELGEVEFDATATAGAPAGLEKVAGDGQTAQVGTAVPTAPSVRVTDAYGNAVAGATVTFQETVPGSGGTVTGAEAVTNAEGVATVGGWTLSTRAGANELTATVPGAEPVVFTATGEPGPAAEIQKVGGDGQSAAVGTAVATAPTVRVVDAYENPVTGVTVRFVVTAGGGSATGTIGVTDLAGEVSVGGWTLGTTPGPNTLRASAEGLDPVVFAATATEGPPAGIEKVAGDGQSAEVATSVGTAPAVRVVDPFDNPVSGVTVTFAVTAGGGSVAGAEAVTDENGVAAAGGWTLGTVAGANTLSAAVSGVDPVVFTATGLAGPAVAMEAARGDGQTAAAGSPVSTTPTVRAVDAYGNGVAGIAVVFEVTSGGGAATGTEATTDAAGEAAVGGWTLGTVPGVNTLQATAEGLDPVVFTATATAGTPAALTIVAGDGQAAEVATAVATAPAVRVTDAYANPVAGVTVTFTVTAGGGSATGAQAVTNGEGVATVGSWTLGTTAGANGLTAAVAGVDPVVITATGTAGAPAAVTIQAGQDQTAEAGSAVAVDPAVLVVDGYGNPVAGVSVGFAVTAGGGTVTGSPASTDATGVASVGWVLGDPGANTLEATVAGLAPVTFQATAN